MEGSGSMSRAVATASVVSGQEGPLKWFGKVTLQCSLLGELWFYVSCTNVKINSSVSSHPPKPLGMDDKLYGYRSSGLLEEAADQGRDCEGVG